MPTPRPVEIDGKRCTKCDKYRPLDRFQLDSAKPRKDGTCLRRSQCKDCANLAKKQARDAKKMVAKIHANGERKAKSAPESRMTEREQQRRLRAAEGLGNGIW